MGEIVFKTIVARGFIFSSKCTRKRLAAVLRPDPLGSLSAPLYPQYGSGVAASRLGGAASRSRIIVYPTDLNRKLDLVNGLHNRDEI